MRVLETQSSPTPGRDGILTTVGIVAAAFSVLVCLLMIANHWQLQRTDPIHSPGLARLMETLKEAPDDAVLREQIRDLDRLVRHAFFSSQAFNRTAIWLLVGGLAVSLAAFHAAGGLRQPATALNPNQDRGDLVRDSRWARQAVAAVGLVLVGFALSISLPFESPLDESAKDVEAGGPGLNHNNSGDTSSASGMASVGGTSDLSPAVEAGEAVPVADVPARQEWLANWPWFRGPLFGRAVSEEAPTDWDGETGRGILWKTVVPRPGFSSPVVWGERVFLSGADKQFREVYGFDLNSGQLLWTRRLDGASGTALPKVTNDTGYAAPTMATDGRRVYAIFATGETVAFTMDGAPVWTRTLGNPDNHYGHASSLLLWEGLLLVQWDQQDSGAVAALKAASGEEVWRTERTLGPSWASPVVVRAGETAQLVLAAEPAIVGYDPSSGDELWRLSCLQGGEVAPSPVFADGRLFVSADYVKLAAIDVASASLIWEYEDWVPGVSTAAVSGDYVVFGLNDGGIGCVRADTGEEVWIEETDEGFYASAIAVGQRVYLLDRNGWMHVVEPGPEFRLTAKLWLGEGAVATPAFVGGRIVCRGLNHLFLIGS